MSLEPIASDAGESSPDAPPLLLDACAVVSWLDPDGVEAPDDRRRLDELFEGVDQRDVSITIPTVVEVTTVLSRKFDLDDLARTVAADLANVGVTVVPFGLAEASRIVDVIQAERVARTAEVDAGRRVGRLSLGDRIAVAAAVARRETLVTTDQFLIQVCRRLPSAATLDYRES